MAGTGIDDNVALLGDWGTPSPSPRTFFSAMLGEGVGLRTTLETASNNRTKEFFLGSPEEVASENSNRKGGTNGSISADHFAKSGSSSEQKSNLRVGLGERIAARAGFNAPKLITEGMRSADVSLNSEVRSPYLTIPPGLSPTTLLDSPVFLSNSVVQPSPTTGKLTFSKNDNCRNSILISEPNGKSQAGVFRNVNSSSCAFRTGEELSPPFFLGASNKMVAAAFPQRPFPGIEVSARPRNSLQTQSAEETGQCNDGNNFNQRADMPPSCSEDQMPFDSVGGGAENSPPLDDQLDEEEQIGGGDSAIAGICGAMSEDGYNWRKYGQKQVKGSEYPRSYYKCTHLSCLVKKKVERSHEGHITEIIYKGAHNHPKPPSNRRSVVSSSNLQTDSQPDNPEQAGVQSAEDDQLWGMTEKGTAAGAPDWRHDNLEVTSSASMCPEYGNQSVNLQAQNGTYHESGDAVDGSSTFSNEKDEDDGGTHGSVSFGYDGEGDESDSKRRKIEGYATDMSAASRAVREPRVVVQTTSEVDILDDGYRWRKYGQKVVKGNPNPRSYYKCTNAGCTVRKHVERASHDLKSVITTYEGKHNHDVPAARNSGQANSGMSNTLPAQASAATMQAHVQKVEPPPFHGSMARYEAPGSLGSFGQHARPQLGSSHGFAFGMNQPGLANLAISGLVPCQGKLPVLPIHPFLPQHQPVGEMGFMLPKGEPKAEPMTDPALRLSNGYQQITSRLPLGPQM